MLSVRILSLCLATAMVTAQSVSPDAPVPSPSPLDSVADVPSNMAEVSVISSAAPARSIQTVTKPPGATSSPPADLNIESLILSLTPCATGCLTQLPALMEQLNIDSSSSLSDEAVALCQKNRNLISTCSVSCNSTVLSTIAATCATVGGLGGAGAGSSPIPTVRSAPAFSDAVSNLGLVPLLLGVVGMLVL
ncbi:hypothetical protein HDU81_000385 [Chytriomyces hyalinus]|nr:hypothetical protein HDU81_000385 [Chytriomyces hyalinus]